jgi:hypothetical protein
VTQGLEQKNPFSKLEELGLDFFKQALILGKKAKLPVLFRMWDSAMKLEAPGGFEPPVEILQTSALPLGDGALI